MTTRVLDWKSRHDPRSLEHPVRTLLHFKPKPKRRLWLPGPILDQGTEGACVGHGWTNELTASPVRVDLQAAKLAEGWPRQPQPFAFYLYQWCKRHDEFAGEDYDGTSVLTGAQAMKQLGLIESYRWAFTVADIVDSILIAGPVVLGIAWHESMYDAPGGEVAVAGDVVGGHCLLAIGYEPTHIFLDGTAGPAIALLNSWGPTWGKQGVAWIKQADLVKLLRNQGEACVPVHRSFGR